MTPLILDGPLGTELLARGVDTPLPGWSAHALDTAPELVESIHRDYAAAGADIHTTNTFRTQPRHFPRDWRRLTRLAVELARRGIAGSGGRLAGSIAPLEDCYSPELSPADCRGEHRQLARALADKGVDLLLVETFPHVGELLVAVEEAAETGLPVWAAFTTGPNGDLLSKEEVGVGARAAVQAGAAAVLVNCLPVPMARGFVAALTALDVPIGVYANAGQAETEMGFVAAPADVDDYVTHAQSWVERGASIVGACCGTGVAHIAALRARFPRDEER